LGRVNQGIARSPDERSEIREQRSSFSPPFGGEKVEDPARLAPALANALAEVRDGRTMIVNVVLTR
jgi:hypothetical protein